MEDFQVLILAAGKGKRMKSKLPKVLHKICGKEMINILIDKVKKAGFKKIVCVLGFKNEEVKKVLDKNIKIVIQNPQEGTAHAVLQSLPFLKKQHILILYGDHPLIKKETLKKIAQFHKRTNADLTLLITELESPNQYGRIIRDCEGRIRKIKEFLDLRGSERKIKETNPGVMCFKKEVLEDNIKKIKRNKKKGEFYLTEIVEILYLKRAKIREVKSIYPEEEGLGVNTFQDLIRAEKILRREILESFLKKGVKIFSPELTLIDLDVKIGRDTVIYPFTVIERNVKIGKNCIIGPFSHIREGTIIKDNTEVGNFAELKNTFVDSFTKIKHFCYLGDSQIGKKVNIGAGTVTANFDGIKKHKTTIGDGAFIGCDTILIAPVKVGKNAKTGAGTVIPKNKDVEPNSVVIGVPAKKLIKK